MHKGIFPRLNINSQFYISVVRHAPHSSMGAETLVSTTCILTREMERHQLADDCQTSFLAQGHNSFTEFVLIGPKGSITGTPEGTGAREVGSSLVRSSSPIETPAESESPMHQSSSGSFYSSASSGDDALGRVAGRRRLQESSKATETGEEDEGSRLSSSCCSVSDPLNSQSRTCCCSSESSTCIFKCRIGATVYFEQEA